MGLGRSISRDNILPSCQRTLLALYQLYVGEISRVCLEFLENIMHLGNRHIELLCVSSMHVAYKSSCPYLYVRY